MLEAIGLALAGRAGARLAVVLGMPASRDSLLRLVRALPDPSVGDVEVLGVDDFAIRRCQAYGTVLVDILAHRPVDLIEERTSKVLADWLGNHPGVKVICRDRSGAYAEGARTGAPEAIQVADRWHLWANLGEAVERIVLAHRACLGEPAPEPPEAQPGDTADGQPAPTQPDSTAPVEYEPASRLETRTRERHTAVTELRGKGYSLNAICRELGLAFVDRATLRPRCHTRGVAGHPPHPVAQAGSVQVPYAPALERRGHRSQRAAHRASRAGMDRQPA
jgi:Transposase